MGKNNDDEALRKATYKKSSSLLDQTSFSQPASGGTPSYKVLVEQESQGGTPSRQAKRALWKRKVQEVVGSSLPSGKITDEKKEEESITEDIKSLQKHLPSQKAIDLEKDVVDVKITLVLNKDQQEAQKQIISRQKKLNLDLRAVQSRNDSEQQMNNQK